MHERATREKMREGQRMGQESDITERGRKGGGEREREGREKGTGRDR